MRESAPTHQTDMRHLATEQVLAAVSALPSLPAVVSELMADLQSDGINLDVLAAKIAMDPALTARLLHLANSSFYGLPRQVDNVTDAVTLLGLRNVRSLVTAAAIMGKLPLDAGSAIGFGSYWRHGIATALCAQKIAGVLGLDPDRAYVAGLLHDIGRLVLASQFARTYRSTLEHHVCRGVPLVHAERLELGLDHAMVGSALAAHWKFPESIRLVIAEHHNSERADLDPMVGVVHLSNEMARALEHAHSDGDRLGAIPCDAWQRLGLTEFDVCTIFTQADEALALATDVLS